MKPPNKKHVKKSTQSASLRATSPKKKASSKKPIKAPKKQKPEKPKAGSPVAGTLKKIQKENLLLSTQLNQLKRGLAIEAALEKVRARTMAMQKSDELVDTASILFKQFQLLGIPVWSCGFNIWEQGDKVCTGWMSSEGMLQPPFKIPLTESPTFIRFVKSKNKGETFYVEEVGGKALAGHYEYMLSLPDFAAIAEKHINAGYPLPSFQINHVANFKHGNLIFITSVPVPEAHEVFERFAIVFEQTYTRFLDLQKAEAQAREAEIQLSLERIRASAMAMKSSKDLETVAAVLREQMAKLGEKTLESCLINIYDKEDSYTAWYAFRSTENATSDLVIDTAIIPWKEAAWSRLAIANYRKGTKRFLIEADRVMLAEWYQILTKASPRTVEYDANGEIILPDRLLYYFSNFTGGSLVLITADEATPEARTLLDRAAKNFELAYTRFEDLQKAEAQAREVQIQLALERVRARTMAMKKSDELPETSALLFQQVKELFETTVQNSIGIVNEASGFVELSTTIHGHHVTHTLNVPIDDPYVMAKAVAAWKAKRKSLKLEFTGQELKQYNAHRNSFLETKVNFPEDRWIVNIAFFSKGWLSFSSNKNISDKTFELITRFAAVFEQTYIRFNDLKQAEAQAREAQIQLALERVRARTMAMRHSTELADAASILFKQLEQLGAALWTCGFAICDKYPDQVEKWMSSPAGEIIDHPLFFPTSHPEEKELYDTWRSGIPITSSIMEGEDLRNSFANLMTLPPMMSILNDLKESNVPFPSWVQGFVVTYKHGYLLIVTTRPFDESEIFIRFAKTFEQTYIRFLDLQKAEAQAQEAQIEAALERVRSRSMAMHKSEELLDVITVVSQQLELLNLKFNTVSFATINQEHDYKFWFAAMGDPNPLYIQVPYLNNPMNDRMKDVLASGVDFYADTLTPEESRQWHEHMFAHADLSFLSAETKAYILRSGYARSIAITPGILLIVSNYAARPYSDEENEIIKRFASVFQQSYTRFLDLKKAEAQAREAQIEAALERVRSRAMAMQTSEELNALIGTVFTELTRLDLVLTRCLIMTYDHKTNDAQWWMANSEAPEKPMNFLVPYHEHPPNLAYFSAWRERTLKWVYTLEGTIKKEWDDFIFSETELSRLPDFVIDGMRAPDRVFLNASFYNFGNLTLASLSPLSDEHFDILIRFAKVFDLTYTRFNDIKQAEAREKEAIKQSSLDRVRAEIASMRTAKDLERITPLIWKELTTLGISFIRCGVFIMDEEHELIHNYLSAPDGKAIAAFHLPFSTPGAIARILSHWQARKIFLEHWDDRAMEEFANILVKHRIYDSLDQYLKPLPKGGFYLHFLPFHQGMLYVGSTMQLDDDALKLIQSLADAFSTAYARYEDFNRLEAAKQQVDETLVDLKQAQQQLVQSEKMASLGELTAGIAHEIQNPLNFVNNFSEVNEELLAEMKDELGKGRVEDALALANDVLENQKKINHHGKRADAIVKGMLQHSRTSAGQKEPTGLNALCDEYLRLSYHGYRAKDKTFNAKFETDFDSSLPKINVVPQDIGRVVLNLINNAFYAVSEKFKIKGDTFEPLIIVCTKNLGNKIEITVKDNGNGIPDSIKDKIFQPFFTTKPTGQGTGLGLSLSYDVVKAHGGALKVETKEGDGSEFIIQLPTN